VRRSKQQDNNNDDDDDAVAGRGKCSSGQSFTTTYYIP
jgi:hypothetical protein